tara:strand:- start:5215 stop:5349 length:135 start_codon:yes stop_codon:yes gene_type:complete
MSQNPVDNVLVLNTGDDLYRSTAHTGGVSPAKFEEAYFARLEGV